MNLSKICPGTYSFRNALEMEDVAARHPDAGSIAQSFYEADIAVIASLLGEQFFLYFQGALVLQTVQAVDLLGIAAAGVLAGEGLLAGELHFALAFLGLANEAEGQGKRLVDLVHRKGRLAEAALLHV